MVLVLELGAEAPPLAEQIPVEMHTASFQRDADAITHLLARGLLTPYLAAKARARLIARIELAVKAATRGTTPRFHPKVTRSRP